MDFKIDFDAEVDTWTASVEEMGRRGRKHPVTEEHSRPVTALRRLAAKQGVEVDLDRWYEFAEFPGELKEQILKLQQAAEAVREAEEVLKLRGEVGSELAKCGLNNSEIGRLLGVSPARMGVLINEYRRGRKKRPK